MVNHLRISRESEVNADDPCPEIENADSKSYIKSFTNIFK